MTSTTTTMTNLKQLDVVIPKDKFGDHKFIFTTLMSTSLDVLQVISQNSDQDFLTLVREFLPDLKNITHPDVFLSKWGITMDQITSEQTESVVSTPIPLTAKPELSEPVKLNKSPVAKKKIIKKLVKPKAPVTPQVQTGDVASDDNASVKSTQSATSTSSTNSKPKKAKKIIIKSKKSTDSPSSLGKPKKIKIIKKAKATA